MTFLPIMTILQQPGRQESRTKAPGFSPRRVAEVTRLHGNDRKKVYRSVRDSTLVSINCCLSDLIFIYRILENPKFFKFRNEGPGKTSITVQGVVFAHI